MLFPGSDCPPRPENAPTGPVSLLAVLRSLGARRLDPATPVLERVGERLLEGDLRLPAQRLPDLRGITQEVGDVGRTEPGGVLLDINARDPAPAQIEVEDLPDSPAPARAEIVNLAGFAALQQKPVAPDDIPD